MNNAEDAHKQPTQPLPVYNASLGDTPSGLPALNEDEIDTPAPLAESPNANWSEPRRPGTSCVLRLVVGLCFAMSVASLALNAFLIYTLSDARQTAVQGLDTAIAAVDDFAGKGFNYDFQFEQAIPVSAEIPIEQDLVFPFEGTIPINTTVEVPIDAGALGRFIIEVPINTSVTVDTEVPIHVEQTFEVSTTIPISMTIPVDVQPDDPEIQQLLRQVREWLVRLRNSF